jgi:flagellar basal-body rod protein FlgG
VKNFTQGNLQQTGNGMDVAINGNGFFPVELPDGSQGFTRDGSIQVNSEGVMVTSNGYPILGPITVPAESQGLTISADGTVTAKIAGQAAPQTLGQLQLATFINPTGLSSEGQNLYRETAASGAPTLGTPGQNGAGILSQGYVETSNVNVVEELVGLIQSQRAYEINSKAISTSDQMLQRISQL